MPLEMPERVDSAVHVPGSFGEPERRPPVARKDRHSAGRANDGRQAARSDVRPVHETAPSTWGGRDRGWM
jgi:hypothetical protein